VAAGAIGFSTNRFRDHRDSRGVLCPGTLASADEVVLCARACAEAGGKMFDMHSDFVRVGGRRPPPPPPAPLSCAADDPGSGAERTFAILLSKS
jgi:hypothetical protein